MSPLLSTREVSRSFVTARPLFGAPTIVQAVSSVDLDVQEGETLAIVGESGCGKSTLARLLVRLLEPTGGTVQYDGRDISHLTGQEMRDLRREMQFIFQDPFSSLNPRMTVGALIGEPLATHGIGTAQDRPDRVGELLGRVGLTPAHATRYPHEFSGGQRQRIGIARALATGPKILIGDEPVSALDVSIQAQVVNILQDLKADFGLTLVIIAHDLAVIRHMADRVAVMYLGQIVEVADTASLFANPQHPYTEMLLSAIPVPKVAARRAPRQILGDLPNPMSPPQGCRFHPRCPHATSYCAQVPPPIEDRPDGGRIACHHADALTLQGIDPDPAPRNAAAEARFAHYRRARAAQTTKNHLPTGD